MRPRSRRLLLVLAVAPWLVVAAVLLGPVGSGATGQGAVAAGGGTEAPDGATGDTGGGDDGGAGVRDGGGAGSGDVGGGGTGDAVTTGAAGTGHLDAAAPAAPGAVTTAGQLAMTEFRGLHRVEPGLEEAAALAVAVARAWLTGVPPVLDIDGVGQASPDRYVEHLAIEAIEVPTDGAAVVTLLAVLLDGIDDAPAVSVRRLAVPIAVDRSGPRPGGTPWWLPGPSTQPRQLQVEESRDPAVIDAAVDAFHAAGFDLHDLVRIGQADRVLAVAWVRARTPEGEELDGPVWLRRHGSGFVVAGSVVRREPPGHWPGDGEDGQGTTASSATDPPDERWRTPDGGTGQPDQPEQEEQ